MNKIQGFLYDLSLLHACGFYSSVLHTVMLGYALPWCSEAVHAWCKRSPTGDEKSHRGSDISGGIK